MHSDSNEKQYDAVALLSGGLDSILAAKVVMAQGVRVKCLHFVSPFFGKPHKLNHWGRVYGLDIDAVDVSREFAELLVEGPPHGYGKVLNPCVDCKILMLRLARELMDRYGASFIISGEVVGQRPMSQRRDALNIISRDAGVRDTLVRPLCAKRLAPTPAEEAGLVDRERLLNISGRGRKEQLRLAEEFGLEEIPTPAGGCMLAEVESARRYWPVLKHSPQPTAGDFALANTGRQFWSGPHWLVVGRDQRDNQRLEELVRPGDIVFKVQGFPGPLSLGRQFPGRPWSEEAVRDAAAFAASYSPKARKSGAETPVQVRCGGETGVVTVLPARQTPMDWQEPTWERAQEEKKEAEAGPEQEGEG
jgi:hypothetical protein